MIDSRSLIEKSNAASETLQHNTRGIDIMRNDTKRRLDIRARRGETVEADMKQSSDSIAAVPVEVVTLILLTSVNSYYCIEDTISCYCSIKMKTK
jgi:hypothetical protein